MFAVVTACRADATARLHETWTQKYSAIGPD